MNWKVFFNGLFTAAITGGALALGQMTLDPDHFNLKMTGSAFALGAIGGVVNWIRKSPWAQKGN
jgi:hypothetical protein